MRVKKSLGFGERFSQGMQLSLEAAELSELHDVAVSSEYFSDGHQRSALQVNPELRRLGPLKLRHATKQINCGKQPPLSTSLEMWLNLGKKSRPSTPSAPSMKLHSTPNYQFRSGGSATLENKSYDAKTEEEHSCT
jgi:hypothetical protein